MMIHKNTRSWFLSEKRILKSLEKLTVFGFICTLLLVVTVPLNTTILAQVFELFVPPGDPVDLPLVGNYGSFPLLVGVLFALTEVAFSALIEQKRHLKEKTIHLSSIIALMIIVEAGLNFYRSWIIEVDTAVVAETFWDKLITVGSPSLAAFIGVVVPLAMVILAGYAMHQFIMPGIKNLLILLRFSISSLIIGIMALLFGFHNKRAVVLPGPVSRLVAELSKLKTMTAEMTHAVGVAESFFHQIKAPSGLGADAIEENVNALEEKTSQLYSWSDLRAKQSQNTDNNPAHAITNKLHLRKEVVKTKNQIREFFNDIHTSEKDFQDLSERTLTTQKNYKKWAQDINEYDKKYDYALQKKDTVSAHMKESKIALLCTSIIKALKKESFEETLLSKQEIIDLAAIVGPPEQLSKSEKDWRKTIEESCKSVTFSVRIELIEIQNELNRCERWLNTHKIQADLAAATATEVRLAECEKKLITVDQRLESAEKNSHDLFQTTQTQLREMALQLRALFIWMSLLVPLKNRV